ncbi:MAG: galactose mutarotase, partial [Vagococcus sp.]
MSYSIYQDSKTNIDFITLKNDQLSATFLNFGARWHDFLTPDKNGKIENILLTLDTPENILADTAQFGALVGPVAGRIKDAKWQNVRLEKNNGEHHIHGGSHGWWCQFWDYKIEETSSSTKVIFSLTDE